MSRARTTTVLSPIDLQSGWYLRSYLIQADTGEQIDVSGYTDRVRELLHEVETAHMSQEFEYFRIGFVVGHFGRRGVCVSIWHWGRWITSLEFFNQRWYTYGRDLEALVALDGREPILSEFEVPLLSQELGCFHQVASEGYTAEGRRKFIHSHLTI